MPLSTIATNISVISIYIVILPIKSPQYFNVAIVFVVKNNFVCYE
jgi:hypothetical protein